MLEKGLFDDYEKCLQDEPAATTARCPVHVDVPELCAEIARGDFEKAFAVLQRHIPFAGVFCLICDHPCEQACVRNPLDAPVRIGDLERAAVRYGRSPYKRRFKISRSKGRVAVVGGGISGLSAAFDLDRRGISVTLFEQSDRLGGWLWEAVGQGLEVEDIEKGLEAIYSLTVDIRYGQAIDTQRLTQLLGEYDAVFLGTGEWSEPVSVDPVTFRVGSAKLCAGGTLAGSGDSVIEAISSGKRAAITLERMIKNISLTAEREREGAFETLLPKSLEYVEAAPAVDSGAVTLTREQAQQEAARCLQCECDECIKACVHMQRYGRRPKTYAREIYTNENVFLGTHYANKMINSCTLCGLCGKRCPLGLSMAPLVRQTRLSMVENDKMPPSAHDFALRDMAFSNSEQCALIRTSDGAPYLFFPGCQLAASEPGRVEAAYGWLREALPEGVGMWLGCCGAPADWAGRADLLRETITFIRDKWEATGQPTLILACSSCKDVFDRHLPEVPTVSLWEVMADRLSLLPMPSSAVTATETPAGVDSVDSGDGPFCHPRDASESLTQVTKRTVPTVNNLSGASTRQTLNIHDACSTRHDSVLQENVRTLAKHLGYDIEELRYSGEDTKCCGYGGLVFYAHREQEGDFAVDRAKESPHDLLVYCAMCKDLFIDAGKRTFHLLDLLFGDKDGDDSLRRMPTLSERQANRAELKRRLLSTFWNEEPPARKPVLPGFTVEIPPEVQAIMEERLIVSSDVEDALARAIADPGECFFHPEDNAFLTTIRKQFVTYWVRYRQDGNVLTVLNTYSHRMDIKGRSD